MSNIFRKHRQQVLAASQSASADGETIASGDNYELMLAQLGNHSRLLKLIKGKDHKIEKKRELLPEYRGYIDGVLEADKGLQDNVLISMMIWCIDIADFDLALTIGRYALKHKLQTPDKYKRDLVDLLAEEIAEHAIKNAGSDTADLASLEAVQDLTKDLDMIDEVRAKVYKGLGLIYANSEQLDAAAASFELALKHNKNCGVKKMMDKINKQLAAD